LAFFVAIITLSAKSYSNCSYEKINGRKDFTKIYFILSLSICIIAL
jgi:hypothetical protein